MPNPSASFRQTVYAAVLALAPFASAAAAETHLHLAESATVMVTPDEIVASLRAEATGGGSADVQKRVNELMRAAMAAANDTAGVTASTGGYGVWRTQQNGADRWQGSQSLNLTSRDGAALLKLTGVLQQKGLVVGALNWRLAPETERAAHREATLKALAAVRGRVDEAAAALDLRFSQFASVRLDTAPQPVVARMAAMAMPSSMSAAPPVAVAEDAPVTASVEADAILVPR
jgi:predicted secreted protein